MDERYAFGPFVLDCGTRELWRGSERVALTPKAFELLRVLVVARGLATDKDTLLRTVWPDSFVSEDSLTQNIATLRKALGDTSDEQRFIVTVPRHGYRFGSPVQRLAEREQAGVHPVDPAVDRAHPSRRLRAFLGALAALAAFGAIAIAAYFRPGPTSQSAVLRFEVTPPPGTTFSTSASFLALSPDGKWLAFIASRPGEESRLWIRPLDSVTAREIRGTEGALGPFWSPDSRFLAFFAKEALKKVGVLGEPAETIGATPTVGVLSGTWHRSGVILFTGATGIYRIPATGGVAEPVTSIDRGRGELGHVLPQFLPDGRHFLYTVRVASAASFESWVVVRSLDARDDRRLLNAESQALLSGGKYLLFLRDGALLAQSFDPTRRQLGGKPQAVPGAENVSFNPASPRGMFSASENQTLAYRTRAVAELGWYDRTGRPLGWVGAAGDDNPALSHDRRHMAVSRYDPMTATRNLWLIDLVQGGLTSRFTTGAAWDTCPVWSPDDSTIVFARGAPNEGELYEKRVVGSTEAIVTASAMRGCPLDWSHDGHDILFRTTANSEQRSGGLWVHRAMDGGRAVPLSSIAPPTGPRGAQARLSPNGRFIAYESDVSGRREVFVQSFPDGTGKSWRVSSDGGIEPQWRGDGRELFFLAADKKLMAVPVTTEPTFRAAMPVALFTTDLDPHGLPIVGRNQYVVADDGQRFLINQPRTDRTQETVTVLSNWPATIKADE